MIVWVFNVWVLSVCLGVQCLGAQWLFVVVSQDSLFGKAVGESLVVRECFSVGVVSPECCLGGLFLLPLSAPSPECPKPTVLRIAICLTHQRVYLISEGTEAPHLDPFSTKGWTR